MPRQEGAVAARVADEHLRRRDDAALALLQRHLGLLRELHAKLTRPGVVALRRCRGDDDRAVARVELQPPRGRPVDGQRDREGDLPAGRLNPGEDPLDGARREFEEETGYFPQHIERSGYYNQFPGTLRAATNLFFAKGLVPTKQNLDEGEILELVDLPVQDVLAMILSGEVIDGSLQLGVLLALQKGLITT